MSAACSSDEHGKVLDAVAKGDVAGATALMARHLQSIEQRVSPAEAVPSVDLRSVFGEAAGRGKARKPATRRARILRDDGKRTEAIPPAFRASSAKTARQ
jgi:hypothetical protein